MRKSPGRNNRTELVARIDPVAKISAGDVLMWPGAGSNFYNEKIKFGETTLDFTETAIFRNGAPVAQAGIDFKLTGASKHTFGCTLSKRSHPKSNLAGREKERAIVVTIPIPFKSKEFKSIDICLILKEHPTVAIGFTAKIHANESTFDLLKAIGKTIMVNGNHVGEQIYADALFNDDSDNYEVYVTKPYLEKGLLTIHFS